MPHFPRLPGESGLGSNRCPALSRGSSKALYPPGGVCPRPCTLQEGACGWPRCTTHRPAAGRRRHLPPPFRLSRCSCLPHQCTCPFPFAAMLGAAMSGLSSVAARSGPAARARLVAQRPSSRRAPAEPHNRQHVPAQRAAAHSRVAAASRSSAATNAAAPIKAAAAQAAVLQPNRLAPWLSAALVMLAALVLVQLWWAVARPQIYAVGAEEVQGLHSAQQVNGMPLSVLRLAVPVHGSTCSCWQLGSPPRSPPSRSSALHKSRRRWTTSTRPCSGASQCRHGSWRWRWRVCSSWTLPCACFAAQPLGSPSCPPSPGHETGSPLAPPCSLVASRSSNSLGPGGPGSAPTRPAQRRAARASSPARPRQLQRTLRAAGGCSSVCVTSPRMFANAAAAAALDNCAFSGLSIDCRKEE